MANHRTDTKGDTVKVTLTKSPTGFNRTHALGGPMVTGLHVRLYVIRDEIVRVEVADSP